MNKEEILSNLKSNHEAFINCIESLTETQFNFTPDGKWNAGQTLDHLNRAVSTLSLAMRLPKSVFSLLYGKANRQSKTYDELVAKYQQKIAEGGKAHGRYLPTKVSFHNQQKTIVALRKSVNRISKNIEWYSETRLDTYILPHPLLGKLTIREMMYFTMYHAEHHRKIVLRDLG
ncbi:MAG: DinB family protein [Chitinophagales bacterium]|nr:DinB family protein [Chitinophagales bacterium]